MTYKVVTKDNHLEVWAAGFHGESGKKRAEDRIEEGYFHQYMYDADKHKELEVIEEKV